MDYSFINTEYIESVSGGDNEIIRELVTMFSAQAKEVSIEMRALHKKGDYFSLGQLAHKAKSSVAIMGMTELAALLKTFELQAKENKEPEKYESYISRFENDTTSAVLELENFVSNLK
jgi:HPt (histidine-containing phosphotransfer) domain-containing protein